MKGLIRADYYMLKPQFGTYVKMFFFFIIFSVFMKSPMYLMNMQFVVSLMLLLSMMAADENGKDAYYQQLPFARKELVKEKYVRGIIFLLPFLLAADLIGFLITLIYGMDMIDFISQATLGIVYLLLSINIATPIVIKRGAAKSRFICIAFVLVPCLGLIFSTSYFLKGIPGINIDFVLMIVLAVLAALAVLLLPFSYRLSVKYYQQKEF